MRPSEFEAIRPTLERAVNAINVGLQVLFTYADFRIDGCAKALEKGQRVHSARRYRQTDDRWLIVLGHWSKNLRQIPDAEFRGFAWDGVGEYVPLTRHRVIPTD